MTNATLARPDVAAVDAPLSPVEQVWLAECELRIARGLYEAWAGLRDIHDNGLYRAYGTFEDYCAGKWHISRQHGRRLVEAANLVDDMEPIGFHVPNERTARAILDVAPEKRLEVVMLAHKASGGKLDTGWVADAQSVTDEKYATGGYVDDGEGGMTAAEAAVIEARAERLQRQREHVNGDGPQSIKLLSRVSFSVIHEDSYIGRFTISVRDPEAAKRLRQFCQDKEPGLLLTVVQEVKP